MIKAMVFAKTHLKFQDISTISKELMHYSILKGDAGIPGGQGLPGYAGDQV